MPITQQITSYKIPFTHMHGKVKYVNINLFIHSYILQYNGSMVGYELTISIGFPGQRPWTTSTTSLSLSRMIYPLATLQAPLAISLMLCFILSEIVRFSFSSGLLTPFHLPALILPFLNDSYPACDLPASTNNTLFINASFPSVTVCVFLPHTCLLLIL
jgi:hypothetical protein